MTRRGADDTVFYQHSASNLCIYLVVHVDDIITISNDQDGITNLLQTSFNISKIKTSID